MPTPPYVNRGGVLRRSFVKGSDLALLPITTPPANPRAGDLWVYPAGANGEMWMFVYDSSETTAYKWKFIGGAPIWVSYNYPGGQAIGTSTNTAIPSTSLTVPRAGDYIFTANGGVGFGALGTWEAILGLAGPNSSATLATTTAFGSAYFGFPVFSDSASGGHADISGSYKYVGAKAGDVFNVLAWANSTGTNSVSYCRHSVIPVRVA